MDIQIECNNCGFVAVIDVAGVFKSMLESIENDSVYAGFLCENCADEILDENY